jgi:hypothetical protein
VDSKFQCPRFIEITGIGGTPLHTIKSDNNLYNRGRYFSQSDSCYAFENIFETLEKDFSDYLEKGHLVVLGDLNARTGNPGLSSLTHLA